MQNKEYLELAYTLLLWKVKSSINRYGDNVKLKVGKFIGGENSLVHAGIRVEIDSMQDSEDAVYFPVEFLPTLEDLVARLREERVLAKIESVTMEGFVKFDPKGEA